MKTSLAMASLFLSISASAGQFQVGDHVIAPTDNGGPLPATITALSTVLDDSYVITYDDTASYRLAHFFGSAYDGMLVSEDQLLALNPKPNNAHQ